MFKVFVTRQIPAAGIKLLKQKRCRIKISPYDRILKQDEIIKMGKGSDALLCLLTDKIDGQIMDGIGPQLKIIANYAAGFDNIDLKAAKDRNILVTNTPGILTETVTEHAIALLFAITRRIVEADKFARAGKYRGWAPELFLGSDIAGKTLGIVGLGGIGAEVAKRMSLGFGVKIIYFSPSRNKKLETELGIKYVPFKTLLKTADFISLHVPLLPKTHHLIGAEELKMIKSGSYLINTSRGPVVDENALVYALKNKWIKGAAVDVFEFEPELTPGLAELDNVILTPHIASATEETRNKMSQIAAQNIIAGLNGKRPPNLVT